jgi:hypothetical protein
MLGLVRALRQVTHAPEIRQLLAKEGLKVNFAEVNKFLRREEKKRQTELDSMTRRPAGCTDAGSV